MYFDFYSIYTCKYVRERPDEFRFDLFFVFFILLLLHKRCGHSRLLFQQLNCVARFCLFIVCVCVDFIYLCRLECILAPILFSVHHRSVCTAKTQRNTRSNWIYNFVCVCVCLVYACVVHFRSICRRETNKYTSGMLM